MYQLNPYDEDAGTYDKVRDYPRRFLLDYEERHRTHPAHVVTTTWELDDSDVKAVAVALGPNTFKSTEITISKGYGGKQYWSLEVDERQAVKHLISTGSLHTEEAQKVKDCKTVKDLKNRLKEFGDQTSEREKELLSKANTQFKRGTASLAAIDILEKRMPKILYFSEYDKMPGNVALEDMLRKENDGRLGSAEKVFLAFLELVGTNAKEISKIDKFEPLIARLEAASIKITREIFEYWSQNRHLKVEFRLDAGRSGDPPPFNSGQIMRTRIKNMHHDVTVNFDDRSSGFVWFFSFLVLFSQVKKNYGNIIILLDESALGLHAKAQADLLRYIDEKLKPDYQVIYTTHSPFMVDSANLMSARTVEDKVIDKGNGQVEIQGTKVGDDVLSTDKETLFPLQGALGYEITQTLFVGEHTLIVEGPSDLLYLKAFSEALKVRKRTFLDPRWTICPVGE